MTDREHYDVVVIGAGISGMIAGLRAAQGGKHVVVLEKTDEDRYVCNSRLTGGIWHCCQMDIRTDPVILRDTIMRITGGNARPDLAEAIAKDGIRVVRWMQSVGIRFIRGPYDYQAFMLAPPTIMPHGRQWQGRGGDVMLRHLEARLNEYGGRVWRGFGADQLLMRDEGVGGVAGVKSDGSAFTVSAARVVIADGGFQTNPEVTYGPITPAPAKIFQRNARTGWGDGLRMAERIGASRTDMRGFYGHVQSREAFVSDKLWPYAWLDFVSSAGIVVGADGRRFDDEGLGGVHMANAIAGRSNPLDTIVVADQRIWQERGTFNILAPNPRLPEGGGTMYKAATLAELARLMDVPAGALMEEVAHYNDAVRMQTLAVLRPPRTVGKFAAYPIEVPPFYGFPACAGITYTMGGIGIDAECRVLRVAGGTIPGLYAVGCATGGLEGGEKKGYVGGLVKSSVTGLRAAEHILGVPHELPR